MNSDLYISSLYLTIIKLVVMESVGKLFNKYFLFNITDLSV